MLKDIVYACPVLVLIVRSLVFVLSFLVNDLLTKEGLKTERYDGNFNIFYNMIYLCLKFQHISGLI